MRVEQRIDGRSVFDIDPVKLKAAIRRLGLGQAGRGGQIVRLAKQGVDPVVFEADVVVVVEVIDADHGVTFSQQQFDSFCADETGSTGDQDSSL